MPAKRKYTNVQGYYRKGHSTTGHRRQLSDSMMLELAENGLSGKQAVNRLAGKMAVNKMAPVYLLVPDPTGQNAPVYVRQDLFRVFSPDMLNMVLTNLQPFNSKTKINLMRSAVTATTSELSEDDVEWTEVVDTAIDVWNEIEGWFGGSGSGSSQPPATIVNVNGLVACTFQIGAQLVGMGVHPVNLQMIAFTTPQLMKSVFPNLPAVLPVLPISPPTTGGAPMAMVQYALSHPDRMIRNKTGGGYEVVPGAVIVGTDPNGNPIVDPPLPPPGEEPTTSSAGIGSLLPLGLAFLLLKG